MTLYQKTGANIINKSLCRFTVWAPTQKKIEVILENGKGVHSMEKDTFGYWNISIEGIGPGTLYKYRINKKDTYPDPASRFQPEGVHGPSQTFNPHLFQWTDQQWKNPKLQDYIIYELHTGTFSDEGNFQGITDKLDYLKSLGITAVNIMPVAQFPGKRNWGYDGVYPFAVQNSYGGPSGLQQFVNESHKKGIAVILDVVYNHLGPEGNYLSQFGPYFTDAYKTPWGAAVNFDDKYSYGVRNYFIQNALMWFRDFHIDALRLDAIHAIRDYSARHFMLELAEYTAELSRVTGKKHYLIAESNLNDVRYLNPVEKGGYALDAQWSDDYHHAIHTKLTGESFGYYMDYGSTADVSKALSHMFVYDGTYSTFRKKAYGSKTNDNPGEQFVICNQNHDQVGNRKLGERLSTLTSFEQQKLAAVALFMAPAIPMLFMGEEYGEENPFLYFVNHNDQQLNDLVRKGRQAEFKDFWDHSPTPVPHEEKTFEKSKLSWDYSGQSTKEELLELHKNLIALKQTNNALACPNRKTCHVKHIKYKDVITIERWDENHSFFCGMNFSQVQHNFEFLPENGDYFKLVLDSQIMNGNRNPKEFQDTINYSNLVSLQPFGAKIFKGVIT